jgi:hypothetical protein
MKIDISDINEDEVRCLVGVLAKIQAQGHINRVLVETGKDEHTYLMVE